MLETGSKGRKKADVTVCEALAPSADAVVLRPLTVSLETAAELLTFSRSSGYKAAKTAELPVIEFMGRKMVSLRYLEDMVAERTAAALAEMQGGLA